MIKNNKLKIVIVGHVDHGKSTLIGRILYDTKMINSDKLKDMVDKDDNIDFSFFTDHFEEEREQRITIDTTQIFFKTNKREYIIIDAPGHNEFINNMVTGAAQAGAAILIVDACEGIQEETKRHACILSLLGIKQVIIAINKMDLVNYDSTVYQKIVDDLGDFLDKINISNRTYIPIVAKDGDNVVKESENIKWYKGHTIIELLDVLSEEIKHEEMFTIFPVQDVIIKKMPSSINRIFLGQLISGNLSVNDEICVLPSKQVTTVKSIEKFNETPQTIEIGECCGLTVEKPLFLERGSIIASMNNSLYISNKIIVTLFALSDINLNSGDRLYIICSTQKIACNIDNIVFKMNSSTLQKTNKNNIREIEKYEVAKVEISTKVSMVHSIINELMDMSKIVIVKNNSVCATGTVVDRIS